MTDPTTNAKDFWIKKDQEAKEKPQQNISPPPPLFKPLITKPNIQHNNNQNNVINPPIIIQQPQKTPKQIREELQRQMKTPSIPVVEQNLKRPQTHIHVEQQIKRNPNDFKPILGYQPKPTTTEIKANLQKMFQSQEKKKQEAVLQLFTQNVGTNQQAINFDSEHNRQVQNQLYPPASKPPAQKGDGFSFILDQPIEKTESNQAWVDFNPNQMIATKNHKKRPTAQKFDE